MLTVRATTGALILLITAAAPAAAHAEPSLGTVEATFTEPLDAARSRLVLIDEAGERVAEGGVDAADPSERTMVLPAAAVPPGTYEVRWTAVTPDDGGVERGRYPVTFVAPRPPTASPSPPPVTARGSPEPALSPQPATSLPLPSPSPSGIAASPAPSLSVPPASPPPSGGAGEITVPLVALGALTALVGVLLVRRRAR